MEFKQLEKELSTLIKKFKTTVAFAAQSFFRKFHCKKTVVHVKNINRRYTFDDTGKWKKVYLRNLAYAISCIIVKECLPMIPMPTTIAICEDEQTMCEYLQRLVKMQCADARVDVYHSGSALLASGKEYDLYFLDIQMPVVSGIEVAEQIRKKRQPGAERESIIIFITALKEYMQDAFDVRAFHYLIKPIDEKKFSDVLRRALKDLQRRNENAGRHIMIKSGSSYYKVFLKDVLYIESRDRKNVLYTDDGAKEYYGKMRELETMLGRTFFRCHRSYIVNLARIVRYNAGTVWLENGAAIYIAQKKYHDFVKAYMLFARDERLYDE
jgi:DNA-binding LytR/AlgR family response regulator